MSRLHYFRACFLTIYLAALQLSCGAAEDTVAWLEANAAKQSSAGSMEESKLSWYDGSLFTIEGRGFADSATSYSRLAARHEKTVPGGVWNNGLCAAGVTIRFVTDSPLISAEWANAKEAMSHMAWTGSGGVDLYALEDDQKWKFRGVGMPKSVGRTVAEVQKAGREKIATEYLMFLPQYSDVNMVRLGITEGSSIAPATNRYKDQLPVVFYGTSITQGGCASRAGMGHVGILRRWMDYPMINLGFSGAGKCEPIMAKTLAEIPAAVYVVETVSNMDVTLINERAYSFFKSLRSDRPDTPILMVGSPNIRLNAGRNVAWKAVFDKLAAEGMTNLQYLPGDNMYQTREEPTVDGVHPTDLGYYQMALNYEPTLRTLLQGAGVALPVVD